MNDNEAWPLIDRASDSRVVRTLAEAAGWHLTEMPADLGLPLAGCLCSRQNDLLIATTNGGLATSIAMIDNALVATRSDALIVRMSDKNSTFALGLWRSGQVTWHWPLALWIDADANPWLVPSPDGRSDPADPVFRLTDRHLRTADVPWQTPHERDVGLTRAQNSWFNEQLNSP